VPPGVLRRYLALERPEIRETLLSLPGPLGGASATPLLRWRLQEEERRLAEQRASGYVRMAEKTAHLAEAIRAVLAAQEGEHGADR
jgi:hypothetical protein